MMGPARQPADIARIREAARARVAELQRRHPNLTQDDIADRMEKSRKTLDNLLHHREYAAGFRPSTLQAASRALEWPDDALERIGAGTVEPDQLEEVPRWRGDDPEARISRLEDGQQQLTEELSQTRTELASTREEIEQIRTLVERVLGDRPRRP